MANFIKVTVATQDELINVDRIQRVRPTNGGQACRIIFDKYDASKGGEVSGDYVDVAEPFADVRQKITGEIDL